MFVDCKWQLWTKLLICSACAYLTVNSNTKPTIHGSYESKNRLQSYIFRLLQDKRKDCFALSRIFTSKMSQVPSMVCQSSWNQIRNCKKRKWNGCQGLITNQAKADPFEYLPQEVWSWNVFEQAAIWNHIIVLLIMIAARTTQVAENGVRMEIDGCTD